jgi:Protein of unknown function (DUF2845)
VIGMNRLNWITFTLCLLFSAPLFALRCGHSLVQVGDYKDYVNEICGDPDNVQSHYERRGNQIRADGTQYNFNGGRQFPNNSFSVGQSNYAEIEVLVEDWTYEFGSERLSKILRFENGRLIQIESLGRKRRRY